MSCPRNTSSSRTAVYTIATLFASPYFIICSHDILWCFSRCFHAIDRPQKGRREIEICSKFSAATIKEKESNPCLCIPPLQRRLFFLRALAPRPNLPHRTQHTPLPLSPGLPPSIRTPAPILLSFSRRDKRLWRYAIIAEVSNRTQGEAWLPEETRRRVEEVLPKRAQEPRVDCGTTGIKPVYGWLSTKSRLSISISLCPVRPLRTHLWRNLE